MKSFKTPKRSAVLLVFALLVLACGCEAPAEKVQEVELPVVTVAKPLVRSVTDFEDFTGRTEAVEEVEIRARVSGYLVKIAFAPGTTVEKDALLYEIDRRPFEVEVEQSKANLTRSEAAQKRAQAEYDRARRLQGMGGQAISSEEVERAVAVRDEAIATVASSKAALERAELNLSFTRVVAPVAGRISRTQVTEGNLVSADTTLLTTIVSQNPVYAVFDIDDRTMLRIQRMVREGKLAAASSAENKVPIQLGLANEVGYPHEGVIDFVDNRVDPGTGTLKVRGVFDNAAGVLTPGLFVRIRIPIGQPREALLVSDRALGVDQGQKYVLVVEKDQEGKDVVAYRTVQTGSVQEGLRVIEEGLTAEDRVIVLGLQRVRPGVRVAVSGGDMLGHEKQDAAPAAGRPTAPATTTPSDKQ